MSISAALVSLHHQPTGVSGGSFGMCTWSRLLDFFDFLKKISNIFDPQTFRNRFPAGPYTYFPAVLILGQGRTVVARSILCTIGLPLSHRKVSLPDAQVGEPFTQVSGI